MSFHYQWAHKSYFLHIFSYYWVVYTCVIIYRVYESMQALPPYLMDDVHLYSIENLINVSLCLSTIHEPQTNYIVDWWAESESHVLGQTVITIWPMNNVYTIVLSLPFIHWDEINMSSWPRKREIPLTKQQIISLRVYLVWDRNKDRMVNNFTKLSSLIYERHSTTQIINYKQEWNT